MWGNVLKFGMLEKSHLDPPEVGDGDIKILLKGSKKTGNETAKKEWGQGTPRAQELQGRGYFLE